ncbi:MAG TPA: hypothetical protein VMT85_21415 [Thermoanaerobaculia bacterium]|nr:hypothetical protein [Thermoanaerobaculia bacterium]
MRRNAPAGRPRSRCTRRVLAGPGLLVFAHLLAFPGCTGPKRLSDGHLVYNEAVRRAADQELLLNIVRLRYLEPLEFLATTSINSTLSFSVSLDANVGRSGGATSSGAGLTARYSSTPTFSFVPQRGEAFASRLTEPIALDDLVLLVSANRDAHTILRLLVSWMNGLDNREGSVDPGFVEATRNLTDLLLSGGALIGFREVERDVTPPMPVGQVTPSAMLQAHGAGLAIRTRADGREIVFTASERRPALFIEAETAGRASLIESLRLDSGTTEFAIEERAPVAGTGRTAAIELETRSLLHAMAFLSQGIQVPEEHLASGLASSGWAQAAISRVTMEDLFQVSSAPREPEDAALAVRHQGTWFYIHETDEATKRTFFMIAEAFRLALEHDTSRAPVLTLPVAGSG